MLKVFLAEDEFIVREGIKKNVDWEGHGYEFVGEAADGELAFPMIQRLLPDIVITDIKMPFMDGLQLSKLIKKNFPWMEIIILSGFAEFDYAKEAISIGVSDYLTKPISASVLIERIDALSGKIEEKKQERLLKEKYARDMEEDTEEEKKKLFVHICIGDKAMPELLENAEKLGIDITASWYNIIILQVVSTHHAQEEYSGSVVEIYERIKKEIENDGNLMSQRYIGDMLILLKADTEEEISDKLNRNVEMILSVLKDYPHVNYHGGSGLAASRLTEVTASYKQASAAYAHRFFSDENALLSYTDVSNINANETTEFDIGKIDPGLVNRDRIKSFLQTGQQGEAQFFVDEYIECLGESAANSAMFRQYMAMDAYFAVSEFLDRIGAGKDAVAPFDVAAGDINDKERMASYLSGCLEKALSVRDENAGNRHRSVIDEVKAYIEENYGDEELSLNKLASHVNFSPNHLSMIFSEQMGESFIKYLTDFRMNKAKELLRCSSKRGSDISYEVGYKDPHYFSFLFKKTQGVTPTQYRNGEGV